jgi:hypothetical protein
LLAFWWPWIGLTRSLGCFLDAFGQKWVENEILDEKMKDPIFPAPQWLDSRLPKRRIFFFFYYLGRTTRRQPHYTFLKK